MERINWNACMYLHMCALGSVDSCLTQSEREVGTGKGEGKIVPSSEVKISNYIV